MTKKVTRASRETVDLATLALDVLTSRDKGREAYARADAALAKILTQVNPGGTIPIADGSVVTVVDNFAKGNKAWKPCGINRYDVKVSRAKVAE